MSWIDDIKARVETEISNGKQSVNQFIQEKKADATVKLIDDITGKLGAVRDAESKKLESQPQDPLISQPAVVAGIGAGTLILIGLGAWFLFSGKKGK